MMYDMIIEDLRRAVDAIRRNDVEQRAAETRHLLAVLEQLQGTLDMSKGGDAAVNMDRLYSITRAKLLEANMKNSAATLEELMSLYADLRGAWQQVERRPNGEAGQREQALPGFIPVGEERGNAESHHEWSA